MCIQNRRIQEEKLLFVILLMEDEGRILPDALIANKHISRKPRNKYKLYEFHALYGSSQKTLSPFSSSIASI